MLCYDELKFWQREGSFCYINPVHFSTRKKNTKVKRQFTPVKNKALRHEGEREWTKYVSKKFSFQH
jgi:hypothetical protein